jgi:methylated-DNA-protein-cysteine methyltransferase-like protein
VRPSARSRSSEPRVPAHVAAIADVIRRIPRGKVASYGQVAEAAGYPTYHRQVVQVLKLGGGRLPWQRVVAAGGAIRQGIEQRTILEMEGVKFRGRRVDMIACAHDFSKSRLPSSPKTKSPG